MSLGSTQLANVDGVQCVAGAPALRSLVLDLAGCPKLADVGGLRCLSELAELESLTLIFAGCTQLANVDVLQCLGGLAAKLKGSIGEGPNHSNFSHQSLVKILSKFRNFR